MNAHTNCSREVGRKHSRTWRFTDVNYAAAAEDDQRGIFLSYGGVLNSLPTDTARFDESPHKLLQGQAVVVEEPGHGHGRGSQDENGIFAAAILCQKDWGTHGYIVQHFAVIAQIGDRFDVRHPIQPLSISQYTPIRCKIQQQVLLH